MTVELAAEAGLVDMQGLCNDGLGQVLLGHELLHPSANALINGPRVAVRCCHATGRYQTQWKCRKYAGHVRPM